MLHLLLCIALAQTPTAAPEVAPDGPELNAASPQQRLHEAWRRIDLGDYDGARLLAAEARDLTHELDEELGYLVGVSHQLQGDLVTAIEHLHQLRLAFPQGSRWRDATFRLALCHGDLGGFKVARRHLRELRPHADLPLEAQHKVAMLESTWLFEQGRLRRGLRGIEETLAQLAPDQLTWFQAHARAAVLRHAIAASKELDFDVPESRVRRVLEARATYIQAAEVQLSATIDLAESQHILDGLLELGGAYEALADDLLTAPTPKQLSSSEGARYRAGVSQQAVTQLVKARRYFELGVEHATRIGLRGQRRQILEQSVSRVSDRVETLDAI